MTAMHIALGLVILSLTASSALQREKKSSHGILKVGSNGLQCLELQSNLCLDHFGMPWYYVLPTAGDLPQTQLELIKQFNDFGAPLSFNNYCSHQLFNLLCFHYFARCELTQGNKIAVPCRIVCEEAHRACQFAMKSVSLSFPSHLNCSKFEVSATECESAEGSTSSGACSASDQHSVTKVPACPSSCIHVDFSPPILKTKYTVSEFASHLTVCLTLSNVGSFDQAATLAEFVVVEVSTRFFFGFGTQADENCDYEPTSVNVTFPVGSRRHAKQCFDITIVDDIERERTELFTLSAHILPTNSCANFGGALSSRLGSIDVAIIDDDDNSQVRAVMNKKCKNDDCVLRTRISRRTLQSNCYTYVLRVRAVRKRNCGAENCLLEVHVIESWDIGVEVEEGVCYTIPICPQCCEISFSPGKEYVIAGTNVTSEKIFILNTKSRGLIGEWKSKYGRNMNSWVRAAQQSRTADC